MRRLSRWLWPSASQTSSKILLGQRLKVMALAALGLVVLSATSLAYLDRDRVIDELHQFGAQAGLKLHNIQLRGRIHTPEDTLLAALDLKLGDPIFSINLHDLHTRISSIGWVENVIVERRLPATIYIILNERVPIALMQTNGSHQLIDSTGTIINGADPRDYTHLKVVAGNNAAENAASLLAGLKTEPDLFNEVWAVSFQSERRWNVQLKNGMEIRLPEINPISAWSRLGVIDRQKSIISRDLAVIDLRIPKQLVVVPNIPVRGKGSQT